MINLAFLACIGCATTSQPIQLAQSDLVGVASKDWTCNEFSWTPDSKKESLIKINTYDCKMTEGSVYVTKNDGSHLHYQLSKVDGCEWKIMLILKGTTCEEVKNISIVQKY